MTDLHLAELTTLDQMSAAARLFGEVWREPSGVPPISDHVLRALQLSGNYVAGAFDQSGELVGASAGWATPARGGELHSHITGVDGAHHRRGIGRALKMHQRAWALERSMESVTWTFDPLISRNAAFNLRTLRATVERYVTNAYGPMDDELNHGDESDRLFVRWVLETEPAPAPSTASGQLGGDARPALVLAADGGPRLKEVDDPACALLVAVPPDIESLRRTSPAAARAWREAVRDVLGRALDEGRRVVGFDPRSGYLVVPGPGAAREEES